ncbi:unnamed protein product [Knipowitschia caucasica]
MVFSQDLFDKNSQEYRRLEERFENLLVPYLEAHLQHFQALQILSFSNGSVVVNSRLRFLAPVRRGLSTAVLLLLKDFASTAQRTMDLSIDKSSLDVEPGFRADACKFLACNQFSRCHLNEVSREPECVCLPGYQSVSGLPCASLCQTQPDYCHHQGTCAVVPGRGATCRCLVGDSWYFRGDRCEDFVSEKLVVIGAVASILCFLLVTAVIVYFLSRFLRQLESDDYSDAFSSDSPKWSRSQFPVQSESPVLPQAYRRHDDQLQSPPPYTQAPPRFPEYSATSRQDRHFTGPTDDLIQTTLYLERRGSSST